MYADHSYYTAKYGGITVPEDRWTYYEAKAEAYINAVTFGRIDGDNIITEVKNAVCEAAECYYKADCGRASEGIASEHIGDHSVTYSDTADTLKTSLKSSVRFWLINTGLLYRGDENADE